MQTLIIMDVIDVKRIQRFESKKLVRHIIGIILLNFKELLHRRINGKMYKERFQLHKKCEITAMA